jgi:2-oxoglutarate ferredoxin oxidoreductase subunit alpha
MAKLLLSGNEAVSLGAIAAGCQFYSAYPMSPATRVLQFLAGHASEFGIVVEQAEDEIAAMNMAIGAAFMGARSMVGTSGGGFSLMVEGLGLAGVSEIPLVIFEAQRPGPATGMPTKTEQGDLLFLIFASQGEFPRVVLAPTTAEAAFRLTALAFNLAEQHQTPVLVLSDHHLGSSYWTLDSLSLGEVTVDRGALATPEELTSSEEYFRYRLTPSGLSPRAWPGQGTALVVSTGDEHDESGHISEDTQMRIRQVDKRWKKMEHLNAGPGFGADVQEGADAVLVGWGSTYGAITEAVRVLRAQGKKVSHIHLDRLWPFPGSKLTDLLSKHQTIVSVENNSMGQMARLMRMETGVDATGRILKYDGCSFTPQDIVKRFS